MLEIDLLQYKDDLKFRSYESKTQVYDPIRKKYLYLQPEELVRQLVIQYLIKEQSFSPRLIQVERQFRLGSKLKRYDIACFDRNMKAQILIECKSFETNLNEQVLEQIATYNIALQIPYLIVTNGKTMQICKVNLSTKNYEFMDKFPNIKLSN